MTEMRVDVSAVEFWVEETGFFIAQASPGTSDVRVVGIVSAKPDVGTTLDVSGEFQEHDLFGLCFVADWAGVDESDFKAAKDGASLEARRAAKAPKPYEAAEKITDAEEAARIAGTDNTDRAAECISRLISEFPGGVRKETALAAALRITGCSELEARGAADRMVTQGLIAITQDGVLVSHKARLQATRDFEEIAAALEQDMPSIDDVGWAAMKDAGNVNPELTEDEKDAVYFILRHKASMVDVSCPVRAAMIRSSVSKCCEALSRKEPWVIYCDLALGFARDHQAVHDSQVIPYRKVPGYMVTGLDEARESLRSSGDLQVTAFEEPDAGPKFRKNYDGDFSVHAIRLAHQLDAVDLIGEYDDDDVQVLSGQRSGVLPPELLSQELRRDGVPACGPWCLGDRVLSDGKVRRVTSPNDDPKGVSGWAPYFGDVKSQTLASVGRVVLVLGDDHDMNARDVYRVARYARDGVTVIGTGAAVSRVAKNEIPVARDEMLYSRLRDLKRRSEQDAGGVLAGLEKGS